MDTEEYERGLQTGKQDARLDNHDRQFIGIQTALDSLSKEVRTLSVDFRKLISELSLAVQALALNAKASADTAITLAEGVEKERTSAALAIKKEKDDEQNKRETIWTPWSRVALLVTAGAVGLGVLWTFTH